MDRPKSRLVDLPHYKSLRYTVGNFCKMLISTIIVYPVKKDILRYRSSSLGNKLPRVDRWTP